MTVINSSNTPQNSTWAANRYSQGQATNIPARAPEFPATERLVSRGKQASEENEKALVVQEDLVTISAPSPEYAIVPVEPEIIDLSPVRQKTGPNINGPTRQAASTYSSNATPIQPKSRLLDVYA